MTFTIALTGHRPGRLDGYNLQTPFYRALRTWLDHIIESGLQKHEHFTLRSGMALGADTIWAEAIVAAREKHPGQITFIADVPVMTQPDRWPSKTDRDRWAALVAAADEVVVYAEQYTPACLHDRNRGMIQSADMLLAVWDGTNGGTAGGVSIAKARGIPVFLMSPKQIRKRV